MKISRLPASTPRLVASALLLIGVLGSLIYWGADILAFVDRKSGFFSLIFSGVVALASWQYMRLTRELVHETRHLRQAQTEPILAIYTQSSPVAMQLIDLVIENVGAGPATNIHLKAVPDFEVWKGEQTLAQIGPFKNGIPYLPPRGTFRMFLTSLFDDHDQKITTRFVIEATFGTPTSAETCSQLFDIEFASFEAISRVGEPPLESIKKDIEKIARAMEGVTSGMKKLHVLARSQEEENRADREFLRRYQQRREYRAGGTSPEAGPPSAAPPVPPATPPPADEPPPVTDGTPGPSDPPPASDGPHGDRETPAS